MSHPVGEHQRGGYGSRMPVLAGRVQAGDPQEDNAVFDLLYDYETVPLSRGTYSRNVTFAGTPAVAVYREHVGNSSHNIGTLRGDKVALCIPLVDTNSCWWGQPLRAETLPISRSGQSIHFTYHGGHENLVLAVDRALCVREEIHPWNTASSTRGSANDSHNQQFLRCPPQRMTRWVGRMQKLLETAARPASALSPHRLENEVVAAVCSLFSTGDIADLAPSTAKMLVEAALERIDTSPEPPSVADLCVALHVGRRTLELAFRHVVGKSPRQYLLQRQLSRSYALLKKANSCSTRVTDVAIACGFSELGRFAGRYRQAFGETPRQTLLRQTATRTPQVLASLHDGPS